MSVAIVGELNPYGADPRFAMYPDPPMSAGARMQSLVAGLDRKRYIDLPRYNLCVGRWSNPAARLEADRLLADATIEGLVLLGRKVVGAFFRRDLPQPFNVAVLSPDGKRGVRCAVLPHPSGLCRAWNEPRAFLRAQATLREAFPSIPWGENRVAADRRCAVCQRDRDACGHFVGHGAL